MFKRLGSTKPKAAAAPPMPGRFSKVVSPRGGSVHRAAACKQGMIQKRSKTLKTWSKLHCMLKINGVRARMEYTKASAAPSKSGRAAWKGFEIDQVESVVRPKGMTDVQFNVILAPPSDPASTMVRSTAKQAKGETMVFKGLNALDTTEWIAAIESCMNMDHAVIFMKAKLELNHRKRMMQAFFNECHRNWEATAAARDAAKRWGERYQERRVRAAVSHCFDAWCELMQHAAEKRSENRFAVRLVNAAMDRHSSARSESTRHAFDKWLEVVRGDAGAIDNAARTALETRLAKMLAASARRVKELEAQQSNLTSQLEESRSTQTVAERVAAVAEAVAKRMRDPTRLPLPEGYSPPTLAQSTIDLDGIEASVAAMMHQFEGMETAATTLTKWQTTLAAGHEMLQHAASVLSPGADHSLGSPPRPPRDESVYSSYAPYSPPAAPYSPPAAKLSPTLPLLGSPAATAASPPTRSFDLPASPVVEETATGACFFLFAEHWVADGPRRLRAVATTWLKRRPEMSALLAAEERLPVLDGQTIPFIGGPLSANDFTHWRVELDFAKCVPPFYERFSASPSKSPRFAALQPAAPSRVEEATKRNLFDPQNAANQWVETAETSAHRAFQLAKTIDMARETADF